MLERCDEAVALDSSTIAAALTRCGVALLRGALSSSHLARLANSFEALPPHQRSGAPLLDGRTEWLPPFPPLFSGEAILRPRVLSWAAGAYLGGQMDDVVLDALTIITAPDGTAQQSLHRDVTEGPGSVLTIQMPLVDLPSPGGGALALQPGSHAAPAFECNTSEATIEPSMRVGDALMYDARTCHRGAGNEVVRGARPVMYLLLKHHRATLTGYLPFELNLRFGRAGLENVLRFRDAFDCLWRTGECRLSACTSSAAALPSGPGGSWRNASRRSSCMGPRAAHTAADYPLASISPYLLRPAPHAQSSAANVAE